MKKTFLTNPPPEKPGGFNYRSPVVYRLIATGALLLLLVVSTNMWCQSPANDQHWNTTTLKFQDDFNNPLWMNWAVVDPSWWPCNNGSFDFDVNNVNIVTSIPGTLPPNQVMELKATTYPQGQLACNPNGFIRTGYAIGPARLYGYYETRMDLSQTTGNTYMPAFWLQNSGSNIYHEIDMEIRSTPSTQFDLTRTIWNNFSGPSSPVATFTNSNFKPGLENGWHKYGIEWLPNHIIFYYDDQPFDCTWTNIPNHPMMTQFSLGFFWNPGFSDWQNNFPGKMLVDYTKIYDLNMAGCGTFDTDISTPFNPATYDYSKIPQYLIFMAGNSSNFNNGQTTILRANDIDIYGDFYVQQGTEVHFIPTQCYSAGE